jgi:diguanylate cyclase (GGDEF)-like protein/PAS domain S-box-containing protein
MLYKQTGSLACNDVAPGGLHGSQNIPNAFTIVSMNRLLGSFVLCLASVLTPAWAEAGLRLGVLAFRPKEQVLRQWQPLADHLQIALGRPVTLSVYDPPELEASVAADSVDVVLTTPSHFIALKQRYGLSAALATQITRAGVRDLSVFGGVAFTRVDTTAINGWADLVGKRIAITSNDFTGGYQMQAFEMLQSGLAPPNPSQLLITGMPQDLPVEAVLHGGADAGFVRAGVLEALVREGKLDMARIKVIHPVDAPPFPYVRSTRLYPEWPVVVMPQVDERLVRQLAVALLSLPADSMAARTAGIAGFSTPADYTPVQAMMQQLRVPPFDAPPEFTLGDLWHRYTDGIVALMGLLVLASGAVAASLVIQNTRVRRSQSQYRNQSQRISEIIWGTNIGTWEWNVLSGDIILNERWAEIIGCSLAEIAPFSIHTWIHRTHPDDIKLSGDMVERCFKREIENYQCEIRMRHKNGDWIWVLTRGRVVEWHADGRPLRMSGTLADITERKRAEQRQLHHNRVLSMLAEKQVLSAVLHAMATDVEAISPGTLCCILLLDVGGRQLRMGAAPSLPDYYRQAVDGLGIGSCGAAAFTGKRVVVDDIANHPDWVDFSALAQRAGLGACWSQPILSTDGSVLGTFALYYAHPRSPTPQDLQLLEDESKLAALAIEKTGVEASLQLAASVFTHAREGIMITDIHGNIVAINDTFTHITGYGRTEVIGQNPRFLHSGRQDTEFYNLMWTTLAENGHWSGEIWNRRKNGEIYAEAITISAVRDTAGQVSNYVALFTDITSAKEHQGQLERFAHFDALTGLPNRVLLADRLQQAILQSQRRGLSLAVLYLDLDGFKAVNDQHSHSVGDELLIALAQRMKSALRDGDTLARIGGDEFVAVLADLEQAQDFEAVIHRLLQAAAEPVVLGNAILQVSASIGVTQYPQDASDADQLMRHADQAMYTAKLSGKNRCHHFDVAQDAAVKTLRDDLEHIRRALDQGEFTLYYQPKVNMKSGEVVGAEALIRWNHPERGLLSPAAFLPIIENHPISIELGEWVIDSALAQMETWLALDLQVPVSVNIGVRQLQRGDFVARLTTLLQAHPNVPPLSLELEVLETSAMEDIAQVSSVMHACRALGVGFALDDFGTGYSSLTYLKHLPAELLKIDQSFVRDMLDDPDDLAIVESVIGLANAFRRNVIAEGVETAAHGELLLTLGCELAQGYGIARPMPGSDIPSWLQRWRPHASWTAWRDRSLSRGDKAVVFVEVGHRHWLRSLEAYFMGDRTAPPPMEASECHFGRWQISEGQPVYGKHAAYRNLVALHDQVHRQAKDLVTFAQNDGQTRALAGVAELRLMLDELSERLRDLVGQRTSS